MEKEEGRGERAGRGEPDKTSCNSAASLCRGTEFCGAGSPRAGALEPKQRVCGTVCVYPVVPRRL